MEPRRALHKSLHMISYIKLLSYPKLLLTYQDQRLGNAVVDNQKNRMACIHCFYSTQIRNYPMY